MRWLPAALAAASVAVLMTVPPPGTVRLAGLSPPGGRTAAGRRRLALLLLPPAVGLLAAGPVAALLAGGVGLLARRALSERQRASAHVRERGAALDALSLLAAELRSGRPAADALQAAAGVAVGRTGEALGAAAATARLGGDVGAALSVEGSAVPEVLRGLAACWQVCSAAGSGLAAGVERLDDGLRAAEAQRRAVDAELAGPRATAGLLAGLPVAGIGLAAALGAHPLHVLLHTPVGLACLTGGLLLDGAGVLWTRRLVAGAVSRA